jgi:RNA polymerase sigma-70 factor (ECF subfamily)
MNPPLTSGWQDNPSHQIGASTSEPAVPRLETHNTYESGVEDLRASSPEALFRQAYRSIVKSLALASGDLAAAEDATQEAFIEACVRWNRIARYENPAVWVRRVAINRPRSTHRSRNRAARAIGRLASESQMVPPPREPETGLATALKTLPPRQRLAAVLYYVDDLTIAEVASAMGVSQGAVSQHLSRARTAFRTHMGNSDDDR